MTKKLRVWKATAMLLDGKIANVMNGRGHAFHNGIYGANEGPIKVEIREIRKSSESGAGK